MQFRAVAVTVVAGSLGAFVACVGADPQPVQPDLADASSTGASSSSSTSSSSSSSSSSSTSSSTGGPTDSGADACSLQCKNADVLQDCNGNETACGLGCVAATNSCKTFDPSGVVNASDLALAVDDAPIALPDGPDATIIDTSTGEMKNAGSTLRPNNLDPEKAQTLAKIGFVRRDGVAIFHAKSWTLKNVYVRGTYPIAFVATDDIKVEGHVLLECGQAGAGKAGNGGSASTDMSGFGSGASAGGGGGNGTAGAVGADGYGDDDYPMPGGTAGPVYTFDAVNLRGGGNGGQATGMLGAGGGAILLAAGLRIHIGDGNSSNLLYKGPNGMTFSYPKGINAGGCGGTAGATVPAGGGGAGGTILIEAPKVSLDAAAGFAANGGGGGGTGTNGTDGRLGVVPAPGGTAGSASCFLNSAGGDGAAGTTPAKPGKNGNCGEYEHTGGGGGGVGRVLIRTQSGMIETVPTSIQSPLPAVSAL